MFLFAVARWGQRNSSPSAAASPGGRSVSIRCREMGTAELQQLRLVCHRLNRFLFAVARWGQRNQPTLFRVVPQPSRFLFAVARWGQRNPGPVTPPPVTNPPPRFYSLSRDGDSGTTSSTTSSTSPTSFYSLSRDGDSGTPAWRSPSRTPSRIAFLFAVARWGQRNRARPPSRRRARVSIRCREMGTAEPINVENQDFPNVSFYSLSRDGDSGTASDVTFTPATPSCFYSLSRDGDSGTAGQRLMVAAVGTVSIRCREMGTAERDPDRRR